MKNSYLKPEDYRWVRTETGEEILMTAHEEQMRKQKKGAPVPKSSGDPGKHKTGADETSSPAQE